MEPINGSITFSQSSQIAKQEPKATAPSIRLASSRAIKRVIALSGRATDLPGEMLPNLVQCFPKRSGSRLSAQISQSPH